MMRHHTFELHNTKFSLVLTLWVWLHFVLNDKAYGDTVGVLPRVAFFGLLRNVLRSIISFICAFKHEGARTAIHYCFWTMIHVLIARSFFTEIKGRLMTSCNGCPTTTGSGAFFHLPIYLIISEILSSLNVIKDEIFSKPLSMISFVVGALKPSLPKSSLKLSIISCWLTNNWNLRVLF